MHESDEGMKPGSAGFSSSPEGFTEKWSIGIYSGATPLRLRPAPGARNPVLTRRDVTDIPASFVADPFMIRAGGGWHMFFEVWNAETGLGEIGLATSADALSWTYRQIVLREPYHLSYPYVFEWGGDFFMIPETLGARAVRLYRAVAFPLRWEFQSSLVEGELADPSVVRHGGKWWMFACPTPHGHDSLRLYVADELEGPWAEHPRSPLIEGDRHTARPAGRLVSGGGRLLRFAQDCSPFYGTQVRAFEIRRLTPDTYEEAECAESPVLVSCGAGWNGARMHHVCAHEVGEASWLACVDGYATPEECRS